MDKGRLVSFDWADGERLVCVTEYASARVYNLHGDFTQFSLGPLAKETGVLDCRIWGTGIVKVILILRVGLPDWKL